MRVQYRACGVLLVVGVHVACCGWGRGRCMSRSRSWPVAVAANIVVGVGFVVGRCSE